MILSRILLTFVGALLFAAPTAAKEAPEPVTTSDPHIPIHYLELRLEPLTKGELEIEAEAWRDLIKAAVVQLTEANISSQEASKHKAKAQEEGSPAAATEAADTEKEAAITTIADLHELKSSLLSRFKVVLDAWEKKGGDPSEYRAYASVVSGVELNMTDPEASISAFKGWLKSEDGGIKWGNNIEMFVVIMLIAWLMAYITRKVVAVALAHHSGSSALLDKFVNKLIGRVVLIIGFFMAISSIGIHVSAMFALIGGTSFILAFAMQDTLSNFANGIMLLIYRPFDAGDVVELGGVSGIVDSVSLVNTSIKTFDNKLVLLPNKSVWGNVITNLTAHDTRRVDMVFGISYEDDVEHAQAILEKAVAEEKLVLPDPEPVIRMHELADSSVNFVVRPWSMTSDYWAVYWALMKRVKSDFDDAGISIPYPQQDVHMHQIKSNQEKA